MTSIETTVGRPDDVHRAARQVFRLLRLGFSVAPILFGLDKFFNWMVDWPDYLAGWVDDLMPGTAQQFMYVVGGIEIAAGVLVAVAPVLGAPVVAAWLGAIIVNLLTLGPPTYYDLALRDFGLMLGALALARLAWAFRHRQTFPAHVDELDRAEPDVRARPRRELAGHRN